MYLPNLYIFIALLAVTTDTTMARVSLNPTLVVQAEGSTAQFFCEIELEAIAVKWSINDTYLSQYHPPGVTVTTRGGRSNINIPARDEFNGSAIKCTAVSRNYEFETSNATNFSVQGPLSAVTQLSIRKRGQNGINVTWVPPFSLNLTYAEPDVVYCVNVSRVVNDTKTHVMSNCSVLGNEFVYNSTPNIPKEQHMYYEVTVFGRSNVIGSLNGSAMTVIGPLPSDEECIDLINGELTRNRSTSTGGQRRVYLHEGLSCEVNASSVEDLPQTAESAISCFINLSPLCTTINRTCSRALIPNRKYSGHGYCYGVKSLTFSLLLNTHDIKKVAVTTDTQTGHLNISCHFTVGSSARGCFVVALYLNEDTPPLYRAAYRLSSLNITLHNINTGRIKLLSFYEIEIGNTPTRFPAHTEIVAQDYTIHQDTLTNQQFTSNTRKKQLCATFNSTGSSHLMVYHSCSSDRHTPLQLYSIHHNTRNSVGHTNTSMCVEASPGCYWVTVFGLDTHGRVKDNPVMIKRVDDKESSDVDATTQEVVTAQKDEKTTTSYIPYIIGASTALAIIVVTVCTVSLVIAKCKCKSKRHDDMNFEMDICDAYEAVNGQVWQDFQNHYYEAVTLR